MACDVGRATESGARRRGRDAAVTPDLNFVGGKSSLSRNLNLSRNYLSPRRSVVTLNSVVHYCCRLLIDRSIALSTLC